MRIKYSPFIDKDVLLTRISDPDLSGRVVLHGSIANKDASLTLTAAEAARIFRALRAANIEAVERIYTDQP